MNIHRLLWKCELLVLLLSLGKTLIEAIKWNLLAENVSENYISSHMYECANICVANVIRTIYYDIICKLNEK